MSIENKNSTSTLYLDCARAVCKVLGGNPDSINTWEQIKCTLFDYARVKFHYNSCSPIILEELIDKIVKSGIVSINKKENKIDKIEPLLVEINPEINSYVFKDSDIVLTGYTNKLRTSVKAKNVELKDVSIENGGMQINAETILISNMSIFGSTNTSLLNLNANEINVTNSIFDAKCINALEIHKNSNSKKIIIDNCEFSDSKSNAIVFNYAENAEITVKNCKFIKSFNPFLICKNLKATFNFINCYFDIWNNKEYEGMIVLQDNDKLIINIKDCYYKCGVKLMPLSIRYKP